MSGEAILFTPAVGFVILRVLALLLLPVLPLAAVWQALVRPPPPGPALSRIGAVLVSLLLSVAAVACGVLFAPALLYASSLDGLLRFSAIFPPAGAEAPWRIGFDEFLAGRVLPLLTAPAELVRLIAAGEAAPDIARSSLLLAAVALLLVVVPPLHRRDRAGLRAGARNLLLVFWGAYATVYTVALVLWLASLLNFWCFLVLFVITLLLRD
jgi:hypothetical protein